jgi:DNA-binding NarL/FixJ family response regulator
MRVFLADNQAKVRSALRLVLQQDPDLQVVGEVADTCSLLEQVEETLPDVLMLDWDLTCISITNLMSELLEKYPHMVVIAMSGRVEAKQEAFKAGAHAFVNKGAPPESLLETLHAVADKPGDERN